MYRRNTSTTVWHKEKDDNDDNADGDNDVAVVAAAAARVLPVLNKIMSLVSLCFVCHSLTLRSREPPLLPLWFQTIVLAKII